MRSLVCLITLLLSVPGMSPAEMRNPGDREGGDETVCITTDFSVEIDYPNFFVSVFAHITGAHFSRLTLQEWDVRGDSSFSFLFHLNEGRDRWLDLSSDTLYPSYLKLPLSDRVMISRGALDFARILLQFMQVSRKDTVHSVFEYAGDTLGARAYQLGAADSGSGVTTTCRVETWNRDTGEHYIDGEVTAVTQGGYTSFPDVRVSLINKDIKMHFTPVHVGVSRTRK
jgi:hypothetical protein